MVRATRDKVDIAPTASKIDTSSSNRSLHLRVRIKRTNATADATTKPRGNNKNEAINKPNCVQKCVVKIKRIKLPSGCNDTSNLDICTTQTDNVIKTPPNAQLPVLAPTPLRDNVGDVTSFEPSRNSTMCLSRQNHDAVVSPCRVRIKRVSNLPVFGKKEKETEITTKPRYRFFHRDQPARTRSSVTRHVYEFLSQSQIEDKEEQDPAADIIKKMVNDGRACAMVRLKTGKSRARAVRKKIRPVGRRKKCSIEAAVEKQPAKSVEEKRFTNRPLSPIFEPEIDSNDEGTAAPADAPIQNPMHRTLQAVAKNTTMIEGGYSPLARCLLHNQTKTQQPQESVARRRELLEMAKRFVSTPLNRKNSTMRDGDHAMMSPILNPPTSSSVTTVNSSSENVRSPSGGTSPWRVADEAPLPNTFVFGFNSSQLPSYSSDFIRRRHVSVPHEPEPEPEPEPELEPQPVSAPTNDESTVPDVGEKSADSLANDSNGENVPPPPVTVVEQPSTTTPLRRSEVEENENCENNENFVQLPNPRRTLQHRSPLKDINILDVVVLPSWKKNAVQPPKIPTRQTVTKMHDNFENIMANESTRSPRRSERQQQPAFNLFGFEDFLTDAEEGAEDIRAHDGNSNVTLNDKLQRLKVLRPKDKELPAVSKDPMRHAYDESREPKQRNIKEMLCSTMIDQVSRALGADESAALFKDIDPETTFDEKKPHRTYVRERPKRKRKQRVHVYFVDSDSSEDEDGEQDSNDKSGESPRKAAAHPHKRHKTDLVHKAKLKEFITSFNQECAEVENFPLIVE